LVAWKLKEKQLGQNLSGMRGFQIFQLLLSQYDTRTITTDNQQDATILI